MLYDISLLEQDFIEIEIMAEEINSERREEGTRRKLIQNSDLITEKDYS